MMFGHTRLSSSSESSSGSGGAAGSASSSSAASSWRARPIEDDNSNNANGGPTTTNNNNNQSCPNCSNSLSLLTKLQMQTSASLKYLTDIIDSTGGLHDRASMAKMKLGQTNFDLEDAIDSMTVVLSSGRRGNVGVGGVADAGSGSGGSTNEHRRGGGTRSTGDGIAIKNEGSENELFAVVPSMALPATPPPSRLPTNGKCPPHLTIVTGPNSTPAAVESSKTSSTSPANDTTNAVTTVLHQCMIPYLQNSSNVISPSQYLHHLHNELSVQTVEDLVELYEECLEVLATTSNASLDNDETARTVVTENTNSREEDEAFTNVVFGGYIIQGKEEEFCNAVLDAVGIFDGNVIVVARDTSTTEGSPASTPAVVGTTTPTAAIDGDTIVGGGEKFEFGEDETKCRCGVIDDKEGQGRMLLMDTKDTLVGVEARDDQNPVFACVSPTNVTDDITSSAVLSNATATAGFDSPGLNTLEAEKIMTMDNNNTGASDVQDQVTLATMMMHTNYDWAVEAMSMQSRSTSSNGSRSSSTTSDTSDTNMHRQISVLPPWTDQEVYNGEEEDDLGFQLNGGGEEGEVHVPPTVVDGIGWTCSFCTCINPTLHLVCSACGCQVSESEEHRVALEEQENQAVYDMNVTDKTWPGVTSSPRGLSANAQSFEPKAGVASGEGHRQQSSALSASAQPFTPTTRSLSAAAPSFQPKFSPPVQQQTFVLSKSTSCEVTPSPPGFYPHEKVSSTIEPSTGSPNTKAVKKAVVVEISSDKYSKKNTAASVPTRPAVLPGMEYLMGVDHAKLEAEKKAKLRAREAKKKEAAEAKQRRRENAKKKKVAAEEKEMKRILEEKELQKKQQQEEEEATKKKQQQEEVQKKKKKDDEEKENEMPEVDEMMAVLALSKEDRLKKLDEMFGM